MNSDALVLLVDLIDLARLAATGGAGAIDRFETHRESVRKMVAEGREPSAADWQALADDIAMLRDRLNRP